MLERYLRTLQLDTSASRRYPQTVHGFGVSELTRMLRPDASGPWRAAFAPSPAAPSPGAPSPAAPSAPRVRLVALRPVVAAAVNSAFPFGFDDGPLWAGRGLSAAVEAGVLLTAGPLSFRLQPSVAWSQNAHFPLFDDTRAGDERFRDPLDPGRIDLPQRFGDDPYFRADLGETELRLDLFGVTAGVSNARQSWGPGVTHQLILGPNAPGFVHGFVGTARPVPIGIGELHARVVAGRLEESDWSPAPDSLARRLGTGIVVSFMPGRTRSIELGATRFFHRRWTASSASLRSLTIPLSGFLFKSRVLDVDDPTSPDFLPDNQLASVFARWAPRGARMEVYGEFARNDAAFDVRELLTEPDHQSAYLLGARKLFGGAPRPMQVARLEWVNARVTHLDRARQQGPFYAHVPLVQGHTNRGEVLGSVAVPGGGGFVAGWDAYDARGVSTIELHRIVRLAPHGEGAASPRMLDVQYAASYERTRLVGGLDLTAGAGAVWELNRDFRRDAVSLAVRFGARFGR